MTIPHHACDKRDGKTGQGEGGSDCHGERTIHVDPLDIVRNAPFFSYFPGDLGKLPLTVHQTACKSLEETDPRRRLGRGDLLGTAIGSTIDPVGQSVQGLGSG